MKVIWLTISICISEDTPLEYEWLLKSNMDRWSQNLYKFEYFCPLSPHSSIFAARNSMAVCEHSPRRFVCWGDWGRCAVHQSSLGGTWIPSCALLPAVRRHFHSLLSKEDSQSYETFLQIPVCFPLAWSPVWKHQSITDLIGTTTSQVADPEKTPNSFLPAYWDRSIFLDMQFQTLGEGEILSVGKNLPSPCCSLSQCLNSTKEFCSMRKKYKWDVGVVTQKGGVFLGPALRVPHKEKCWWT